MADTQTGALVPSGTPDRALRRSGRPPSMVLQFASLGLSNFSPAVFPEIVRAARSSKRPVSKEVPPPAAGHDTAAGSGKTVPPALDTWAMPMLPGGMGDGLPGLHAFTI